MPYAADNMISNQPIEGGIPITDEQYEQAREHSKSGMVKVVIDTLYLASKKPHPKQGESVEFDKSIGDWVVTTDPEDELTPEELKEEARRSAQATCQTKLNAMTHTFADGRTVQVRPSDGPNFMRQIGKGVGRNWIMADNTVSHLTLEQLQEAVASGEAQGEVIYDEYMAALAALSGQ